ncbi:MAG: RcgR family putative quorum lactone hydrolase [Candidatus Korobacteraceae bacterium]
MRARYQRWMYEWETLLTTRDTNRVVRPFDWGTEWTQGWPGGNGAHPSPTPASLEGHFHGLNLSLVARSDEFFSYRTPDDFRLETRKVEPCFPGNGSHPVKDYGSAEFLRFTSPVESPYPENNIVNARWFPAPGRRAVIVLPQWNADALSHNGLCRIFNNFGISALRLSMPYHDVRRPPELERADYAVSANVGRTIAAARQAVVDIRSCLDWLESRGYTQLGILGTSLGSCYAFIASSHDSRLRVNAFNHASTYFADVVWTGQSTRHIRAGIESAITLESLRHSWLSISPMAYFDQFSRWPKKSLIVYATYDLTFLPEFSRHVVEEFRRRSLDHRVAVLPCGHYTTGESPYKYLDAWHLTRFLVGAFRKL